MDPVLCKCLKAADQHETVDGVKFFTCEDAVYDRETKKSNGGCRFFVWNNDVKPERLCGCGVMRFISKSGKVGLCSVDESLRNENCRPVSLHARSESSNWNNYLIGDEFSFDPKPEKIVKKLPNKPFKKQK